MLILITILLTSSSIIIDTIHGLPRSINKKYNEEPTSEVAEQRQIFYLSEPQQHHQQYPPPSPSSVQVIELPLLGQQFQVPYNFDKTTIPRLQPQIVIYTNGPPGQPFLLQPNQPPPPGNFLVPQQPPTPRQSPNGVPHPVPAPAPPPPPPQPQSPQYPQIPSVIIRNPDDGSIYAIAGYPKPSHIPPIEKDAEEIPTNPDKIPPLNSKSGKKKPEKLETFTESTNVPTSKQLPSESTGPIANRPFILKPGQRYFILNGQQLFSNYPFDDSPTEPLDNYRFIHPLYDQEQQYLLANNYPIETNNKYNEDLLLKNIFSKQFVDLVHSRPAYTIHEIRPNDNYKSNQQQQQQQQQQPQQQQDDDSIIIEAADPIENTKESEGGIDTTGRKTAEPSISQSYPGATALAGPGGVAAASPRGNAFVGKGGVAVSSPQATAVAGPNRNEKNKNKKRQQQ